MAQKIEVFKGITVVGGLCLPPEIVKTIVERKLAISDPPGLVAVSQPISVPTEKVLGEAGFYSYIEFTACHPDIPNSNQILRCFVKTLRGAYGNVSSKLLRGFNRELNLYTHVFSRILQPEDKYMVPQFIYGEKGKMIVLDDMKSKGYTMLKKLQCLDYEHLCVAVETLARFHARSIIYEEKVTQHSLLDDCQSYWGIELQTPNYAEMMQQNYDEEAEYLFDILRYVPELIPNKPHALEIAMKRRVSNFFNVIAEREFSRMRVMAHSDLTPSNLLFRYDKNGRPEKCCIVDFAYVKYTSLSFDLWAFLYTNSTKEMRNERLEEINDMYYDEFTQCMFDAGLNANVCFPYTDFIEILEEDRSYGLLQALLVLGSELRSEVTSRYGPLSDEEFPKIWEKIWTNSPELMRESTDDIIRYKHRIVQGIVEICRLFIAGLPENFPDF